MIINYVDQELHGRHIATHFASPQLFEEIESGQNLYTIEEARTHIKRHHHQLRFGMFFAQCHQTVQMSRLYLSYGFHFYCHDDVGRTGLHVAAPYQCVHYAHIKEIELFPKTANISVGLFCGLAKKA